MMSGNNNNTHFTGFSLAKFAAFGMIGLFVAGQTMAANGENPGQPFAQLESKLDGLETKINGIEITLGDIENDIGSIPDNSGGINALEGKLDVIETKLDLIEVKLDEGGIGSRVSSTIFVTSTPLPSGGGIGAADTFCNQAAANAGLPGVYVAWLSTSSLDAVDRLINTDLPYTRTDGIIIATDLEDLTDSQLLSSISLDAAGQEAPTIPGLEDWVYTGTLPSGKNSGHNCTDWTDSSADDFTGQSAIGRFKQTDRKWTGGGIAGFQYCDHSLPRYCVEQ